MESTVHNRTAMTCPICFKTDNILSTHLRRKCMKHSSDDEIKAKLAEAKRNLASVTSKGLAIDYTEVCDLVCDGRCLENVLGFLKGRGFIIYNRPPVPSPQICNYAIQNEEEEAIIIDSDEEDTCQEVMKETEKTSELQHNEEEKENAAMETKGSQPKISWSNPLRKKMSEAGMYLKHSLKTTLLSGFVKYLSKTLNVTRYKQEAENVSRFLYFMDNDKPSMDFVFNIEKTNEYFSLLLELGNTHQTVFNYLKSLKRFLEYMKNSTDLLYKDKKVYDAVCVFVGQLCVFQKRISKGISKENVAKKQKCLRDRTQTPDEIENILAVAESTFMRMLNLAKEGEELLESERVTILQYLEAVIIVRKLQRPGVVQHMTVDEWKDRIPKSDHVGITVHNHKTAANQVATVILTKEEESWFDIYFAKVRPKFLKPNKENNHFFISSTGENIYNVSNDIARLHIKFGLKPVTSQVARRMAETFVAENCKMSTDKNHFAKYLAHSNSTAERVYRENTMDMLIKASKLTRTVLTSVQEEASTSIAAKEDENMSKKDRDSCPTAPMLSSKDEEFKIFAEKYPVTAEKESPSLKKCLEASKTHGQHIYDRWRKLQHRMRVDYIIELFQDHLPEEDEVITCIGNQGWKTNLPRVKEILHQWRKSWPR